MPTITFPPARVGEHCHTRRAVRAWLDRRDLTRRITDECRCYPLEWMLGRTPFYVPGVPR